MCGIIGYTGQREAEPILLECLGRMEYRGYDSAGVATSTGATLHVRKCAGRIAQLAGLLSRQPAPGCHGIGHTRWATHGGATDANAHPHLGGNGEVAVVHNGVIENYLHLKQRLEVEGFIFRSATDTEVIAHLIAHYLEDDLVEAVRKTTAQLQGTYALAVISPRHPGLLVGTSRGSPLVLGIGAREAFLASDSSALAGRSEQIVYLKDHQLCLATPDGWSIQEGDRTAARPSIHRLGLQPGHQDKTGFDHFMLKEIWQQPAVVGNAIRGLLEPNAAGWLPASSGLHPQAYQGVERIVMTGCGTSYHAALVGKYLFEELARLPVEVEYASELRYRNPPLDRQALVLGITQSGETADTLAALRELKRQGHSTLALCNVPGSSITRVADGVLYLQAGPEIGVASTKAFLAQVAILTALALAMARARGRAESATLADELLAIPNVIHQVLARQQGIRRIAEKYAHVRNMLFLGRKYLYPVALEGALKLKEISYIHAEGYPAAEMKHGPIALVDPDTPSVILVPRNSVCAKVMSTLEEIKARGGPVIAVTTEGNEEVAERADDVIYVPDVAEPLQPLVTVVPLQLLAYHMAVLRGCDVDKPRNLAKSVTVE